MIVKMLHKRGLKSEHAYCAGFLAIGLSVASWCGSVMCERRGVARADHWGIYVGEWAPTFFALGLALANYEHPDVDVDLDAEHLHPVAD